MIRKKNENKVVVLNQRDTEKLVKYLSKILN